MAMELSHPRVVRAELDYTTNSTLKLHAQGPGECNIIVYLVNSPHIYDIIKVRVTSVVMPQSPVNLHVGGEVNFIILG